ncbi:MAG: fibronectin type III domain-containing protein [Clostridiales bacterium]|nr:fibronectin type III domain-containing protein [Clostridiales bacterium]
MAKALSTLAVGALIKDTGTLYNGKPIVWKIADKNHAGYPANSVTLITERIISLKCFDAIESGNTDSNRRSYGNNRWIFSNVRQWLNSQAAAGKWYSAQHSADAPPTKANSAGYNGYDTKPGFLAGFSASFLAALLDTTHTVGKASVDGGGTETCTDKIFFATCTEVGLTGDATCGTKLALFSDNNSRLAKPTAEAVSESDYTNSSFNANSNWYWWLADAYASDSYGVRSVYSSGALSDASAYYGYWGVRPLCNLKSEILVSDTTDSDGAYTIIWNRAPSAPGSINVPAQVLSEQNVTVTWGVSTDEDGSVSGYTLERKVNDESWAQIYKGINRTYTDTAGATWQTVAYRVKAYDNAGADSEYTTSPARAVVHNTPPAISGTNTNLGEKTGAFAQAYTVTDIDGGQTLTVTEKIDDTVKRSHTVTSGQEYSFNVTAEEWVKLSNGSHTLTITADDGTGGTATRTYTFSKNVSEIEFQLATPLATDDAVTKAIMSVARQIPAGAEFTVEACNNGNDASPTWEDVTQAVTSGSKFFFSNTTKTAAEWGFNFRIKVKRNGAIGDCFISSVGGNFE